MSAFFGFSNVDIDTDVFWSSQTGLITEYDIPTSDDGFSSGMMIIQNTDDGHPDDSSWFYGGKFPTGSNGEELVYAGGPGTDYNNPLAPWADDASANTALFPIVGYQYSSIVNLENPSSGSLKLHLGPGIDYWYVKENPEVVVVESGPGGL